MQVNFEISTYKRCFICKVDNDVRAFTRKDYGSFKIVSFAPYRQVIKVTLQILFMVRMMCYMTDSANVENRSVFIKLQKNGHFSLLAKPMV